MRLLKLQNAFIEMATDIADLVPECPDRTASLRKLLECKFTAVQALTHYQEPKKVAVVRPDLPPAAPSTTPTSQKEGQNADSKSENQGQSTPDAQNPQ